ncbi:MAG: HD domain-containing protein [Pleomorphochaeta sp.]
MNELINEATKYVKQIFINDFSGHDYYHTERVYKLAKEISKNEDCDIEKVCLVALLHDVDDHKLSKKTNKNQDNARLFLTNHNFNIKEIESILTDINNISFSKHIDSSQLSIEAKIVQDADRVDAIGAIGIARVFAYGATHNNPIYDPNNNNSSINHFYEKLLKLESTMNTIIGKKIAKERTIFLQKYLNQFFKEWNFEGL